MRMMLHGGLIGRVERIMTVTAFHTTAHVMIADRRGEICMEVCMTIIM